MARDIEEMTFEDLSSAYRIEMKSQTLGDLRKDLYAALARLQEGIQRSYEAEYSKDPDSIMCEGMNERRKKANSLVQKVVDLRMEKVAVMAIRASMGANNVLDKLTAEEREYYNIVAEVSKKHRSPILKGRGKKDYVIPDISSGGAAVPAPDMPPARGEIGVVERGEVIVEQPQRYPDAQDDDTVVIRILEDLPKIAGPDCDYDLRKEDVVRMPAEMANVLIKHDKAVMLSVTL